MAKTAKRRTSRKRVNVICHGTMVAWFDNSAQKLFLRAPRAHGHSYGAGARERETGIPNGSHCVLEGVEPGSVATTEGEETILLDRSHGVLHPDATKIYCTIELPRPEEILMFRDAEAPAGGFFYGKAQQQYNVRPSTLSLVHVFSYTRFSKPRLNAAAGTLWSGRSRGVQNLHIFAEPAFPPNDSHWPHFIESFRERPDLQPTNVEVKAEPPNNRGRRYGIVPADMKTLYERGKGKSLRDSGNAANLILSGPPPICMVGYVV